MKILHVINFFKPSWEAGGPVKVAYDVSKYLAENGHEVTIYTTDGYKHRLKVVKNKPLDIEGLTIYYFRNLSSYLSSKFLLPIPYYLPIIASQHIKEFDIIHIHEFRTFSAIMIYYFAKKYNIPYVLQAHGTVMPFFSKQKSKKLFDRLWGYKILKNASKVMSLGKIETEQYIKMGVDPSKIEIVLNGVDLSEYENIPKKGEFRNKYGIEKSKKIILYLGRIHRIKGIDLLVEAFSDLIQNVEEARLVIAGPDDGFLSTLKKRIEVLNIGDQIVFTGPLYGRDKLEAYVDADVYVLPSIYEIFGVTVLEACACGTPVIVTTGCGIKDIVQDNFGYVVNIGDDSLHDALLDILTKENLKTKLGENGRLLVKEKFTCDLVVNEMGKLYEKCISY